MTYLVVSQKSCGTTLANRIPDAKPIIQLRRTRISSARSRSACRGISRIISVLSSINHLTHRNAT